MKKIAIYSLIAVSAVTILSFIPKKEIVKAGTDYNVVTEYSKIEWVGSKKSGFHTGTFGIKSGAVQVDNGKLTGGKFTIDLTSVKVTDGAGERLEGHLKNKDFFEVTVNTEAVYEITNVSYSGASTANVEGKLTMKGITMPVNFTAQIRNADDKKFFGQAYFSIDRTQWGINYNGPSNDVQLSIHLFANK